MRRWLLGMQQLPGSANKALNRAAASVAVVAEYLTKYCITQQCLSQLSTYILKFAMESNDLYLSCIVHSVFLYLLLNYWESE